LDTGIGIDQSSRSFLEDIDEGVKVTHGSGGRSSLGWAEREQGSLHPDN